MGKIRKKSKKPRKQIRAYGVYDALHPPCESDLNPLIEELTMEEAIKETIRLNKIKSKIKRRWVWSETI